MQRGITLAIPELAGTRMRNALSKRREDFDTSIAISR